MTGPEDTVTDECCGDPDGPEDDDEMNVDPVGDYPEDAEE